MGLGKVLYSKHDGVAEITLNRPEALNALDLDVHQALASIWLDLEADPSVRVAVLQGAGERAFSVGQDLKETAALNEQGVAPSSYGSRGRAGYPRLTERFDITKPIIAKVNGYALGGGFELALACDIIVASSNAVFGLPEAQRGMIPGAGGVFRLMRQLPCKVAMGYLLSGRNLSAKKAYEFGLVNELAETNELDQVVASWTADLLRASPLSLSSIKEAGYCSMDMSLPACFQTEFTAEKKRLAGTDYIEGPRSFSEKRQPDWASVAHDTTTNTLAKQHE
ncbi:enoyl-CoA hydratase-related protein [Pseudoalteromonas piscicida]|uniref:enoyl-CoA hydratase-related protein n=1 Tax=Pseudoalteromonas piscicida TaxID=43662 RepID=UPI0027E47937|nr:enoyl-CoA hydratase-related protein [Pseudoalteromonas piscicida]WMO16053.1 enoyl-CoA hydratase-related protein [Pseudoalteromonas piscicida]